MEEERTGFDQDRRLRAKQDQDARVAMVLGMSTVLMAMLMTLLLFLLAPNLSPRAGIAMAVLCLVISVVFWVMGKRDDRWMVLCTLMNHMGIGVGLFLLLRAAGIPASPKDLGLGLLPGLVLLGLFCLLLSRSAGSPRVGAAVGGIGILLVLALLGIALALRRSSPFFATLGVCAAVCAGSYGALVWTSMDPGRSIHRTMALVSFAIYLILLAAAAAALILQGSGSDDNKSKRSSSGRKSESRSNSDAYRNSSYRYRRRGPSFGYFYPFYASTYRYGDPDRSMGGMGENPAGSRKVSLFLKWTAVILLVLFLTLLMVLILRG